MRFLQPHRWEVVHLTVVKLSKQRLLNTVDEIDAHFLRLSFDLEYFEQRIFAVLRLSIALLVSQNYTLDVFVAQLLGVEEGWH